jgi:hypothetical protein
MAEDHCNQQDNQTGYPDPTIRLLPENNPDALSSMRVLWAVPD